VSVVRAANPPVIPILAVGGWNFDIKILSTMTATQSSRSTFIRNAISFLRQYNFQGIDLDFEYPLQSERQLFTAFLQVNKPQRVVWFHVLDISYCVVSFRCI